MIDLVQKKKKEEVLQPRPATTEKLQAPAPQGTNDATTGGKTTETKKFKKSL